VQDRMIRAQPPAQLHQVEPLRSGGWRYPICPQERQPRTVVPGRRNSKGPCKGMVSWMTGYQDTISGLLRKRGEFLASMT
jgi:hypothetical protein